MRFDSLPAGLCQKGKQSFFIKWSDKRVMILTVIFQPFGEMKFFTPA